MNHLFSKIIYSCHLLMTEHLLSFEKDKALIELADKQSKIQRCISSFCYYPEQISLYFTEKNHLLSLS